MPGPPTTRRGLPTLDATTRSDAPDVPAHINALANALDNAPTDMSGLAADRPADPGKDAVWYFATDTGVVSRFRVGAGWATVTPRDAAADVPSLRTLGTGSQQAVSNLDPRLSDQRTPANASVSLAKMAAGVGSRLLNVQTLLRYYLGSSQNVNVLNDVSITHNDKPLVVILLHSFTGDRVGTAGTETPTTFRIYRDGVEVDSVLYMVDYGDTGLVVKVLNLTKLAGAHTWRVRVETGSSSGGRAIWGGGHGLLAFFEQY